MGCALCERGEETDFVEHLSSRLRVNIELSGHCGADRCPCEDNMFPSADDGLFDCVHRHGMVWPYFPFISAQKVGERRSEQTLGDGRPPTGYLDCVFTAGEEEEVIGEQTSKKATRRSRAIQDSPKGAPRKLKPQIETQ